MHANAVELEEEPGGGPEADLMSQLGHKWCEAGIDCEYQALSKDSGSGEGLVLTCAGRSG